MLATQIVVITGLSGSGKSTAIHALEDLDYFCIDNLPVVLLPRVLSLLDGVSRPNRRMGLVIDAREGEFLKEARTTFHLVKAEGHHLEILFLEADQDCLVRRYSETRRKHPLAQKGSVRQGVQSERQALLDLRQMADHVIDTTDFNVHELRRAIQTLYSPDIADSRRMVLNIVSFGFRSGLPKAADLVFDVRFISNPYFVQELRPNTGLHEEVAQYVLQQPATAQFLEHLLNMISFLLPQYESEGKSYLTLALGCTGGKHRSVALAEHLADKLKTNHPFTVNVHHRDIPH